MKLYRMAIKLKRPIPSELAEAPTVWPWLVLFQKAFWDLIGDRASDTSPIPWSARQKWAEVHDLDEVATELLHRHVLAQDIAFLGHLMDTRKRAAPPSGKIGDGKNGHPAAV